MAKPKAPTVRRTHRQRRGGGPPAPRDEVALRAFLRGRALLCPEYDEGGVELWVIKRLDAKSLVAIPPLRILTRKVALLIEGVPWAHLVSLHSGPRSTRKVVLVPCPLA